MHFRVERARAAAHRFHGQRGGGIGEIGEALGIMNAEGQHRGGEVDAVHQRQPFFERRLHLFRFEAEKGRQLARFSVWHRNSCLCLREYIKLPYSEERRE